MKRSFFTIMLFVGILCFHAHPAQAQHFFGATGNVGNSYIEVDPATGTGTMIAPSAGLFGPITDVERRSDGVIFGTVGQGINNVITINPLTGAETLVGNYGGPPAAINGLEFVGGILYGTYWVPPGPTSLVTIDQSTGAITIIGGTGLMPPLTGLAYDPSSGIMYAVNGQGPGNLYTINLATGAASLVGSTGFDYLGALEFDSNGILYAGIGSQAEDAGDIITINKATGAGTTVGPSGFSAISGLTFIPAPTPPTPVPTMSEWGLLLFIFFAGIGSVYYLRKRDSAQI